MLACYSLALDFLALLGSLSLVYLLGSTLYNWIQLTRAILAKYFLPHEKHTLVSKFGKWAVVTGSTDGIGKQYALQLAARDLNIVLIARNIDKLTATAKEIESKYSVKTKVIVADFSKGQEVYKNIEKELETIPVGILVNNVGCQINYPKYVGECEDEELWNIINVNVGAVTMLCKMVLPQMKKRQQGAIVNVSSGSELQPLPLMTSYAASKAYVKNFTEALRFEYSRYNITIQLLSPLFINTKMNNFSNRLRTTSLFVPDPEMYAKYAIGTLGKVDHSTGYWSHGIQYFFTTLIPVWTRTYVGGFLNMSFRSEYFEKHKTL